MVVLVVLSMCANPLVVRCRLEGRERHFLVPGLLTLYRFRAPISRQIWRKAGSCATRGYDARPNSWRPSFEGFPSDNRKTFACSTLLFLVRLFSSPRRRVPAALLATAALAIGLPALALGDDASDPSTETGPDPISLVTNETAVEYAPGQL